MKKINKISSFILSGGKSKRFGQDKSLFKFNGKPLIEHVFDVLNSVFKLKYPGTLYNLIYFSLLAIFVVLISIPCFRKEEFNLKNSLLFGCFLIIVKIILDSVITIPLTLSMNYSILIYSTYLVIHFRFQIYISTSLL